MRYFKRAVIIAGICLSSQLLNAQFSTSGTQEGPSLGDIARQNRQDKPEHAATRPEIQQLIDGMTSAAEGGGSEEQYRNEIADLLAQHKFEALDKEAHEARVTKARLAGGGWKLYTFYDVVAAPPSGKTASDTAWNTHLILLARWAAERPQSVTARIAAAESYINWGWAARGHGYANTVKDQGWAAMETRVAQAKTILTGAGSLGEKCPFWFESMQHVALIEGWDKARARALLAQAVAFEPTYYHYYREYANFILPKWYGQEGEAEAFAKEAAGSALGSQGPFLYFEIASVVNCNCGQRQGGLRMSWPEIKQGYETLEQLYGTSKLKMNRFALMAYLAQDHETAREIFTKIGTNWDEKTWGGRQSFDQARAWAGANAAPQVSFTPSR
jgi:hypothetical protein